MIGRVDRRGFMAMVIAGFAGCLHEGGGDDNQPESINDGVPEDEDNESGTENQSQDEIEGEMNVYSIGESFTMSDVGSEDRENAEVTFNVMELDKPYAIGSGGQTKVPQQGTFLSFTVRVENTGDIEFVVRGQAKDEPLDNTFILEDSEGRRYGPRTDLKNAISSDSSIDHAQFSFGSPVNPGSTVTRTIVFDVPSNKNYRFVVRPTGSLSREKPRYVKLEYT